MSLYDGRECPVCDGRTEFKGQPCDKCRAAEAEKGHVVDTYDIRAKTVREALQHLAIGLDTGTLGSRNAEQFENRMIALALKTLADAPDELLGQLGRLLK